MLFSCHFICLLRTKLTISGSIHYNVNEKKDETDLSFRQEVTKDEKKTTI